MFDDSGHVHQVFDFDELANHLLEQGLDASPSRIHGGLCGLLAGGASTQAEAGLDGLAQALDLSFYGELADQVMQFDFHPLLPDDEVEIAQRTEELAQWSKGFLAGFAHSNRGSLSQDSSEILKDFAAIAEAGVDEEADEEESEGSYVEIVEYLRFATLNVFMDSRADAETTDSGEPPVH